MPYTDDPQNVPADRVRFLLGDTSTSPDFTDNEIYFLLEEANDDAILAAARGADLGVAKFTGEVESRKVGPLEIRRATSRVEKYRKLSAQLWSRSLGASGKPYAGGISRQDKLVRAQDGDRVRPAFSRRMQSYRTGGPTGEVGGIEERRGGW